MKVHLSTRGQWVACNARVRACPRLIHIPNMTVAEVNELPAPFLERLIEAVDPPTQFAADGAKEWLDNDGHWHRGHDLPARIDADGTRSWYDHNIPAVRPGGKANMTYPDGSMEWYDEQDELHRDDGPAMVYPEYRAWYTHGRFVRTEDLTPDAKAARERDGIWDYR